MTKADLISTISYKSDLGESVVSSVIEALFVTIKENVSQGEEITLRGFGSFKPQHNKPKKARVIKRNESIVIPARTVPKFVPSKEFIEKVKQGGI